MVNGAVRGARHSGVMQPFLPYGRQSIDEDDIAAVVEAMRSDYLAHGPRVVVFEQAFAARVGAKEAVACSSGTAALHLALLALDVGPGDVCVVPAMTFLSTATAALMCGAQVRFADVHPHSGLMTPETLAEAMAAGPKGSSCVKAVLPVHLGGRLCEMESIALIARAVGASIVEDACHAVGGTDAYGHPVGACPSSDAACFSFHPVKTLAAGEGGMATLNDPERAARMRRLRNHGVTHDPTMMSEAVSFDADGARNPWSYEQVELGFNYRMDEMSAALGASQLKKLDQFVARRVALADLYDAALADLAPLVRPAQSQREGGAGAPGWHLYQVLIDFETAGVSRADVIRRLHTAGIAAQVHYIPLYRQPVFKAGCADMSLPGAEAFYGQVLALPLFPAMALTDVARVVEDLRLALKRR